MSARSYLYARNIHLSPLYRRKKPRFAAKRVRYVTPHTQPRGSVATGSHLPVEILEMIPGVPVNTDRFIQLVSGALAIEWENGIWVTYSAYYREKEITFPRAEGRHVLRNILRWTEGGRFGGPEVWFKSVQSRTYSGLSELNEMSDYLDKLEETTPRGRVAAVIKQDAQRPYLWRVSRPTGGGARVFSYIKPSVLVSLLNLYYEYRSVTTGKYNIYGQR